MVNELPTIIDGSRLKEYLMNRVKNGILSEGLQLSDFTEFYLVNLLMGFERSEDLYVMRERHLEEEPLALMLARALNGDAATQLRELKKIGDKALYLAGLFSEHIQKGIVSRDYYIDMGSSAYNSLSSQLASERVFGSLYKELSLNFEGLADVLKNLTIAERVQNNLNLLELYERWLKSGDEKIEEILIREGIPTITKKISC
jgi:hypothetical protein